MAALEVTPTYFVLVSQGRRVRFCAPFSSSAGIVHVVRDDAGFGVAAAVVLAGGDTTTLRRMGFELIPEDLVARSSTPGRGVNIVSSVPRAEVTRFWETAALEIAAGRPVSLSGAPMKDALTALAFGADLLQRAPTALSGGETAKLVILSHLASQPSALILDGALEQLDRVSRVKLADHLVSQGASMYVIGTCEDIAARCRIEVVGDSVLVSDVVEADVLDLDDLIPEELTVTRVTTGSAGRGLLTVRAVDVQRSGVVVLRDFLMEARGGEIVWLTGRNGSGKSTVLEFIARLLSGSGYVTWQLDGIAQPWPAWLSYSPQSAEEDVTEIDLGSEVRRSAALGKCWSSLENWLTKIGASGETLRRSLGDDAGARKLASVLAAFARSNDVVLLDEPSLLATGEDIEITVRAIVDHSQRDGLVVCASHDRVFRSRVEEMARGRGASA